MQNINRRGVLAAAAGSAALSAATAYGQGGGEPRRGSEGADIVGPTNPARQSQEPFTVAPPVTDHGSLPNMKWSFADSHMRLEEGGWARETTIRELPVSKEMSGVNMRLKTNAVRELHWHKEAEWSYVLKGRARITAIDQDGHTFVGDVGEGDLWYFPGGTPHSIQGLQSDVDGVEFLLVFDSGSFSEDSTFLLTDWLAHTPKDVLAKNFGVNQAALAGLPKQEKYIFPAAAPASFEQDKMGGAGPVSQTFAHRMLAQAPQRMPGGSVRITDTKNFPASKTIAAALVELEPGGLRELHWHPNGDEWQYYIEGEGRMTVFGSEGKARTFDYRAGDVGYVPFAMGHYIENTGSGPMRFLEVFRSDYYADFSLNQWMKLTPPELVMSHLNIDRSVLDGLSAEKHPVLPGKAQAT
jgi:oxalate decarboxylase